MQEIYGVDLKGKATTYSAEYEPGKGIDGLKERISNLVSQEPGQEEKRRSGVCVWEIWDKTTGEICVVCDGYKDFLVEPQKPDVQLERFWPFFPLVFNDLENDETIYPRSDVHLLKPMQREYNRCREGLRQHRIASRPKTAVAAGQLSDDDIAKLQTHPANAVIVLQALPPNGKVSDLLQPIQGPPISADLYDTGTIFEDVLRVVGTQEANLGGTSSATATESSIAESSRMSALGSNVDDLDDLLTEVSRATGQLLLKEMSQETATKIAGPGAVWPQLSGQEIAEELYLEVEAGSSGRPNKAAEIANFDKVAPILLQIPGISPEWLAKQAITRLDDRLDPTDAVISMLPSIVAQNAAAQPLPSGDPNANPQAQGPQGGQPQGAPSPQDQQTGAPSMPPPQ